MNATGTSSSHTRPMLTARVAHDCRVKAKVQDAEFPINIKQHAEVLAERVGRNLFRVIVEYGESTADLFLRRSDLHFT